MMRRSDKAYTAEIIDLCERAVKILERIGFSRCSQSMASEARYYRFDGFRGVIRVAWHRQKKSRMMSINGHEVVAKITFNVNQPPMTDFSLERTVMFALGRFMLAQQQASHEGRDE